MEATKKIELAEANIRQALMDYGRHTSKTEVLQDVSDCFIRRLAKDNYYAKKELRELFRKSPVWDERLDALVINGTRTHDPDYFRIKDLAHRILEYPIRTLSDEGYRHVMNAIPFFSEPSLTEEMRAKSIAAIRALAPKAYAPTKKPTRIFRALCGALGVTDETCDRFSYLYAQLADEMTSHKIDFRLFVSLNPAHFITMSNPKADERGNTLTSCHSFNSTEYSYNNGCSGYARDEYTFIVFTVVDPTNAETLNNRKNMRQIFCYKPGNGVLLQSRLYNDAGGTYREQAESKIYRDLVQREISALEEQPNLWRTFKYYGNSEVHLCSGYGFGGYEDWEHEDFNAKVSIRADHEGNFRGFEIGTWGLCICCGNETDQGLYCDECKDTHICDQCGDHFSEEELYTVYDRDGETLEVCEYCRDRYYSYCGCCGEYYPQDVMTETVNGSYVCPDCLEANYVQCQCCNEWVGNGDTYSAVDRYGDHIDVCESCIDNYYVRCDDCEEFVNTDDAESAYDEHGHELRICPCCIDKYERCKDCDRLFKSEVLVDGLCPECAKKTETEVVKEEIA